MKNISSTIVPVLVSSVDPSAARRAAEALLPVLPSNDCVAVRARTDTELGTILDFVATNRAGLVSAAARELLASPEGRAKIARRHVKRLYADPSPPLFPPALDPFGLTEDFVKSLAASPTGWTTRGGWLTAETNGVTTVLITLDIKPVLTINTDALAAFKERLDAALATVRRGGVSAVACGVPIHTAMAAARCKSQVGWLSVISIAFILLLSVFVFRSVRWIPLLAFSLVVSALSGTIALLFFFRSFHMMTFVFGTTVLGLVIDYSFHWLLQKPGHRATVTRSLLVSFLTTEVSLLPLVFSSLPVLRQSAVFLGAGLAAALAVVLTFYPKPSDLPCHGPTEIWLASGARWTKSVLLAVVAALLAVGLCRLRFGVTPQALYRPPPELASAERFLAERSGAADGEHGTLVISGGTLEERLEAEESLNLPAGTPHLSAALPSLAKRRAAAADVARLYAEQGVAQKKRLGLAAIVPPSDPAPWRRSRLPSILTRTFLAKDALLIPSAPRSALPPLTTHSAPRTPHTSLSFWQPYQQLSDVLSDWTREALGRLGLSLALLLVLLAVVFRRAALSVAAPSLVALAVVGAVLGWRGESANLFHLLAAFLLVGMGLDYSVFLRAGRAAALKPAFCSLATSLVGFGLLSFVSFPVVQAFGITLGIGLPAAFAASFAIFVRHPRHLIPNSQTEHAASPLGMEVLLLAYRIFGLRVLELMAGAVGVCAWAFSPAVRRASPDWRKVAAFARSLADKTVVMAGGRRLPSVETDGSADAAAFLADVRAGRGVFVLSSHVGTVEVLAALGDCRQTFHAWMDVARTSAFNAFYLRHVNRARVKIHPIDEIGLETAFWAGDALERGDSLVMAGDRGRGAFRFAHAMGAPVYFIACVAVSPGRYRAIVRRLPGETAAMENAYAAALGEMKAVHPGQWFEWVETAPTAVDGNRQRSTATEGGVA
ncbi:MAG: hypothetical protein J6T01_03785 [Kiritimatiellae bacterium]|nr:hypothetical protein [Kiritimatiellia bacterium]